MSVDSLSPLLHLFPKDFVKLSSPLRGCWYNDFPVRFRFHFFEVARERLLCRVPWLLKLSDAMLKGQQGRNCFISQHCHSCHVAFCLSCITMFKEYVGYFVDLAKCCFAVWCVLFVIVYCLISCKLCLTLLVKALPVVIINNVNNMSQLSWLETVSIFCVVTVECFLVVVIKSA